MIWEPSYLGGEELEAEENNTGECNDAENCV